MWIFWIKDSVRYMIGDSCLENQQINYIGAQCILRNEVSSLLILNTFIFINLAGFYGRYTTKVRYCKVSLFYHLNDTEGIRTLLIWRMVVLYAKKLKKWLSSNRICFSIFIYSHSFTYTIWNDIYCPNEFLITKCIIHIPTKTLKC